MQGITDNLEFMKSQLEEHLNVSSPANEAVKNFCEKVCGEHDFERYLKSIFYSHIFEQYWSLLGVVSEKEKKGVKIVLENIIKHLPQSDKGKINKISEIMKKATLYSDTNESIDCPDSDYCTHELGCIGGKYLNGALISSLFVNKLISMQNDHIWPKSRTPHSFVRTEIDKTGMVLCEYHNQNKMTNMSSRIYIELE